MNWDLTMRVMVTQIVKAEVKAGMWSSVLFFCVVQSAKLFPAIDLLHDAFASNLNLDFPFWFFPKILCLVQFCKATKSWVFLPVPVSCTRTVHFKHMTRASERQLRINMWQLMAPEDTGFDDW